jgi:hypothetical protein
MDLLSLDLLYLAVLLLCGGLTAWLALGCARLGGGR